MIGAETMRSPASQPQLASAGRGGSAGSVLVALGQEEHEHSWRRLPNSDGLFLCVEAGCRWFAVCPACLGSLEIALRLREHLSCMALYWCPAHQGGGRDE